MGLAGEDKIIKEGFTTQAMICAVRDTMGIYNEPKGGLEGNAERNHKALSVCFFSHAAQMVGAERSLLELVDELVQDHGVICSVVLPQDGPLREKLEQVRASTLIMNYDWWCDLYGLSNREIKDRLYKNFKATIGEIKEKIKTINPDVIFTNTMVIPWGAIVASLLNKPHVWFVREFGRLDHDFKFYLQFEKVLKIIKETSNIVFTNSNAVRTTLFGRNPEKHIIAVSQHVDIPPDALLEDKRVYFRREGATRLIMAGSVSKSKGQQDAIFAVKELISRRKNVELIIVGHAIELYLKELKNLVQSEKLEEYVKFLNFQKNVYPLINEADIVLMCSRIEAFGRVTLEAMLLKKPVIGTNSGGTKELIKEEFNGFLYEPGHYKQLADKIEYFIENTSKIRELGENAFKFAKENFTKENYGGRIYEVLKGLKNARNPLSLTPMQFIIVYMVEISSISDNEAAIEHLKEVEQDLRVEILRLQGVVDGQKDELSRLRIIEDSLSWRTMNKFLAFVDKRLFPRHTRRGRAYLSVLRRLSSVKSEKR